MKLKLKLYRISQGINEGYDTFDSAVVAAYSEEQARNMHPDNSTGFLAYNTWTYPEYVRAEFIGIADKSITEPKVICASFNAG